MKTQGHDRSLWHCVGMTASSLLQAQIDSASSLLGASILHWDGIEMAVQEDRGDSQPAFSHPAVPCLQLTMLAVALSEGPPLIVSHYQGDTMFGFKLERSPLPFKTPYGINGIYRRRILNELPTGAVTSVSVRTSTETQDFAEVLLTVDGHEVLLIAGEIEETLTDRLDWKWLDESTLVFTDPSLANSLDWCPVRKYAEHQCT